MYTTCLYCQADLGRNDVVEALPIGRRVAFDGERGRLWVICGRCARWNLTPFDARWEALEQCERAFRATRLRASTDNIGLARVADGVELVRVGRALRPELAAWRYGDQFGRRRRRHLALTGVAVVAVGAVVFGGPVMGLYALGSTQGVNLAVQAAVQWRLRRKVLVRVPIDVAGERRLLPVAALHAQRSRVLADGNGGWAFELAHRGPEERLVYGMGSGLVHATPSTRLTGEDARRAAALVLPHVNAEGGTRREIADAVRVVDEAGGADGCFAAALGPAAPRPGRLAAYGLSPRSRATPGSRPGMPRAVRLALEMAAHEESERRALEGELAELEEAWREAEEIAGIADALLLPTDVGDRFEALRARGGAEPAPR